MTSGLNRRGFLKTFGGAMVAATSLPSHFFARIRDQISKTSAQSPDRGPRIAVLWDPALLELAEPTVSRNDLDEALHGLDATFLSATDLRDKLLPASFELFLNPLGGVFPADAWESIRGFLAAGRHWVNCGGTPFSMPAHRPAGSNARFNTGPRTTAFHRQLGITQSFPVRLARSDAPFSPSTYAAMLPQPEHLVIDELYWQLSNTRTIENSDESDGVREAIIAPVALAHKHDGIAVAAPITDIQRIQGRFTGGRWILATYHAPVGPKLLRDLVDRALSGVHILTATPSYACYRENEQPSIGITLSIPGAGDNTPTEGVCTVEILTESDKSITSWHLPLQGKGRVFTTKAVLPDTPNVAWKPGLYEVHAKAQCKAGDGSSFEVETRNGFWFFDKALLSAGAALTVGRDYFIRDKKPYPITGTTYMASDTHRRFLFDPNPSIWNVDFRQMKDAGVNMVRTGFWTGWKEVSRDGKTVEEASLRALDAFLLTARRYDIPVIFTFFAFLPESWGGENPYLDPASVAAQQAFIAAFVDRYAAMNDVIWDLINEPSFCSQKQLWHCRPNYDRFEVQAWQQWVGRQSIRLNDGSTMPLEEALRAHGIDPLTLPDIDDFTEANVNTGRATMKAAAYRMFAQEAFTGWTKTLREGIRTRGGNNQLVTVGQDEGGSIERPSPLFFGAAVDFTGTHSWWFNDDLLWDGLTSKRDDRPSLIEETGIMFCEKADGTAWNTEQEMRNMLERKFALSFGTAGAGFIEWVWNTNVYMPSENEVAIGFLRADGTGKPEMEAFRHFAQTFQKYRPLLGDRRPEDVVMIIPHSNLFAVRSLAVDATKRSVRTMHYACDTPMRAVSEFEIEATIGSPKLIIVPAAGMLQQRSWEALLNAARAGACVLVSGVIDRDEYGRPISRSEALGAKADICAVSPSEDIEIEGKLLQVEYRAEKMHRVEKSVFEKPAVASIHSFRLGKGSLLWMPLPVEAADNSEPLQAFYQAALRRADIQPIFVRETPDPSVLIRPIVYPHCVMYTIVVESGQDKRVRFLHIPTTTHVDITIAAGRAEIIFIDHNGQILR